MKRKTNDGCAALALALAVLILAGAFTAAMGFCWGFGSAAAHALLGCAL